MHEAGLRVGVTLAMKSRDVAIDAKRVDILEGKGSKPRTVYFRSDERGSCSSAGKRSVPGANTYFPRSEAPLAKATI